MAHREKFESIWYNFTKVALETNHRGGRVAIEWPKGCKYWKWPHIQDFMRSLGIVHYAEVDGCMLGFRTSNGGGPKKVFTVATNDKTLFDTLNSIRCDGNHVHTHLVGGAETEASGHYTTQMARLIHKGWKNSVETRAKNVATPAVGVAAATSFPASFPIPAIPCVVPTAQEHWEKNVSADVFYMR